MSERGKGATLSTLSNPQGTMKIHSLSIVHYGSAYLSYALRSVNPVVERSFIFYTPTPSHGHRTETPPIESRDKIMASIPADEWGKLTWMDTEGFVYEGQHRDYALSVASEGADLVLVLDYDEVYPPETLTNVLNHIWRFNSARTWLVNMAHLWRSFNWIIRDDAWPVRIFDLRHNDGLAYVPRELGPIYHFGYAVTDETMAYKWRIHGHKDELRPGWLDGKWQAWPPEDDCHPTNGRKTDGTGWWNPEPFDKILLPDIMKSHPFYNMERID